ncbi:MAG: V-type ATPase subunit, partial [Nitrospirota bacterium]
CYVSGRVNVLDSSLLGDEFFRRIISSNTLQETHRVISDSPVKAYFPHTEDLHDTDSMLNRYYKDRITDISGSSPDPAVCDIFLLRYDFLNLKNYVKERILHAPYERHPLGKIPDDLWDALWKGEESSLPEIFATSVTLIKRNIGDGLSGVVIDSIIDNAYLCHILQKAEGIGSPMIENFIRKYQLVKGIEIIWRALSSGREPELIPELLFTISGLIEEELYSRLTHSPMDKWNQILMEIFPKERCERIFTGPTNDRLKRFIKETDDYLFQETKTPTYITFGPEQVFLYMLGFTREVFNLGLAIKGRINRIPPALIEERLRRIYV